MPRNRSEKQARQRTIREVIARNEVFSHDQLLALLEVEGVRTTQPTLSRDLRELGAHRTQRGYQLAPPDAQTLERQRQVRAALKGELEGVGRSGTIVVLRARAPDARALADGLRAALRHEALGVVCDRDTILVATRTAADARRVLRWVEEAARLRK
jgi:transcriptional regulator of arginine metabolism